MRSALPAILPELDPGQGGIYLLDAPPPQGHSRQARPPDQALLRHKGEVPGEVELNRRK
jgi:hypothetical protein